MFWNYIVNMFEPYKNCNVMPARFRFSIITSRWSELDWALRSVRRAMLRRSYFFPLKRENPRHNLSHVTEEPVIHSAEWSELQDTSGFLLRFFLKEIHADNKSIQPCWTVVKELFHSTNSECELGDIIVRGLYVKTHN